MNGKPADLATKMKLVDMDEEPELAVSQGESFNINVQLLDDDGNAVNGRLIGFFRVWPFVPKLPDLDYVLADSLASV